MATSTKISATPVTAVRKAKARAAVQPMPDIGVPSPQDNPLVVNSDRQVIGTVDGFDNGILHGWAAFQSSNARCVLQIFLNDTLFSELTADLYRSDLKAKAVSDGFSGFAVHIPAEMLTRSLNSISVHLKSNKQPLFGSPFSMVRKTQGKVQGQLERLTADVAAMKAEIQELRRELRGPATSAASKSGDGRETSAPLFYGRFDSIEGPYLSGWCINVLDPGAAPEVEAVVEGRIVARGKANLTREDVQEAGFATAECGFRIQVLEDVYALSGMDVFIRTRGDQQQIIESPRKFPENPLLAYFNEAPSLKSTSPQVQKLQKNGKSVKLSFLMPVFETNLSWLEEAVDSVRAQALGNWELICVDDNSRTLSQFSLLTKLAKNDKRIRVFRNSKNKGIASTINIAASKATGTHLAFVDHDDFLEPAATYHLTKAILEAKPDLLYTDELVTTDNIRNIVALRARPQFSRYYYLSHPYFVHLVCVTRGLFNAIGGWDGDMSISADVDFIYRAIEQCQRITHVPFAAYRWRTHSSSTGHIKMSEVTAATSKSLLRHINLVEPLAGIEAGLNFNEYKVTWPAPKQKALIVVPTKDKVEYLRKCVDSIDSTCAACDYDLVIVDHESKEPETLKYLRQLGKKHTVMEYSGIFNYSRINNFAVSNYKGSAQFLVLLNNDIEAISPGWLERLLSLAARPDVGAVGPLLLYPNDQVQHAGVVVGVNGAAEHSHKFNNGWLSPTQRNPGYNCSLSTTREYSAVTGACLVMKLELFKSLGGLDESLAVGFNDIDLCLRARARGFLILYDGTTVLVHHESISRKSAGTVSHPEDTTRFRSKWPSYFNEGDPFYNPLLTLKGVDHTFGAPGTGAQLRCRTVALQ